MNVLFLVSSMDVGGAERVAANLSNAWSKSGHNVTVLVTFSGGGECRYELSDGVHLKYLADDVDKRGRSVWTYWKRFFALRRRISSVGRGVVISFLPNVNVAALIAGIGLGVPVFVSERSYPPMHPLNWFLSALRRLTYPLASKVVMQTNEGLRWLIDEIPRARGSVIPNPIVFPLPNFEPVRNPLEIVSTEKKLLLAVGRLSPEKGFDRLILAFEEIISSNPDWGLVILGEGPLRHSLQAQIMELKLNDRVKLPGRVGNLGDWYSRADLYVMSSRFEGFPNTLGEAMAYGCAAISYDCDTGPRDLIRDGIDGVLVSPVGDVSALALSLHNLMQNDDLRNRMAERAKEVRSRYSLERVLELWDKVLTTR